MSTLTIGVIRVKGRGTHATARVRLPFSAQSWHIKLRPYSERDSLKAELRRLNWSKDKLPVTSRVFCLTTPFISTLLTRTVPGVASYKLINSLPPRRIIQELIHTIETLHKTPIDGFPYNAPGWAINKNVSLRTIDNLDTMRKSGKRLHPDFNTLSNKSLRKIIYAGPDGFDRGVLSHGDLCMPNLLFSEDANLLGIVDLGSLQVNNPLLDIALLSWCIKANMGTRWSEYFLSHYNLKEQNSTIQYFRLAYDLSLNFPDPWAWIDAPKLVTQRANLETVA